VFAGIRRGIGLLWTRFEFRHDRDSVVNFTEAFPRAARAVVIYPDQAMDHESSSLMLSYLTERFADGLTVVFRQDLRPPFLSTSHVRMVTYTADDVTNWFTPRSGFVRRLKSVPFDVALDLNSQFSLIGAFLCKASRAPLRVSFGKTHGERFYNIHFQPKGTSRPLRQYQGLVRCLQMFDRS
jgi:hypothetical protein